MAESMRDLVLEMLQVTYTNMPEEQMRQMFLDRLRGVGGEVSIDKRGALDWLPSFDYYETIMGARATKSSMPEDERRDLDWPWASWNEKLDPLEPGLLAVLAAGDGMGKTMYAEYVAEHWAIKGLRVVFVHYELNHALMLDRRTSRHAMIPRRELKRGLLTKEQKERYDEAIPRLRAIEGNIRYQHAPGWSMVKTIAHLGAYKEENECDVVVLDYLEKVAPTPHQRQLYGTNHWQREADNVEQIKNFAEETETPVFMLAQMSKSGKSASFSGLDRTSIRGAGEKTEKANIVVLINRDHDEERGYSNIVNVRIDKNTIGATGNFRQVMYPEYFNIVEEEKQ